MSTSHSSAMIDPIINRNFGNNFHHQNRPNQRQHAHKPTGRQYQSTPFPHLKEKCFGCELYKKEVRELLMQYYGKF